MSKKKKSTQDSYIVELLDWSSIEYFVNLQHDTWDKGFTIILNPNFKGFIRKGNKSLCLVTPKGNREVVDALKEYDVRLYKKHDNGKLEKTDKFISLKRQDITRARTGYATTLKFYMSKNFRKGKEFISNECAILDWHNSVNKSKTITYETKKRKSYGNELSPWYSRFRF